MHDERKSGERRIFFYAKTSLVSGYFGLDGNAMLTHE